MTFAAVINAQSKNSSVMQQVSNSLQSTPSFAACAITGLDLIGA
jgi:hypothetical protein